jgi:serine/threonine protein kinase
MMDTTTQNPLTEMAEIGDILSNRYRVLQIINSGVTTQIYLTEDISLLHDNICLLKRYKYNSKQSHLFKVNKRLFETELNYLSLFKDYDKIPNLLDHFEDEYSLSLIEEVIQGAVVSKLMPLKVNASNCWLELNVLEFLRDTLECLTYINENDIIHGNIKPDNIIQRKQDNIFCLIDFANARKISDLENPFKNLLPFQSVNIVNPSSYLAPETIMGQTKINSDLYSLGIIAIQGLTAIDISKIEISPKTHKLNWEEVWQSHNPNFSISDDLILILDKLVCYDYKKRYKNAQNALADIQKLICKKTAQIIIFTEDQWPGLGFSPSYYFADLIQNIDTNKPENNKENLVESSLTIVDELSEETYISSEELLNILQENPRETKAKPKSKGLNIDQKWLKIIAGIGITGLLIYAAVIYFGLGTILEVVGLDSSGKQLLKAQEAYEAGNLQDAIALAQSINDGSKVYEESQTIIKQWEAEWEKGNQKLQQIEIAFEEKQWETVLQDAKKMPQNPTWKNKLNPLITQAQTNLDQESRKLLQQAINHAEAQEFSEALVYLKQIPLESSFGELVQNKLTEYEEKKEMRAYYNLQQAFNFAQQKDFVTAINFLQKVPPDSTKNAIAQQKIIEYTQMQNIKEIMKNRQNNYFQVQKNTLNPGIILQEI